MTFENFQFRGWHLALGLVFVVAGVGFNAVYHDRPVDAAMRAAILEKLQTDYSDRKALRPEATDADTQASRRPEIEIRSIAAHGKSAGLTVIARVEFRSNGAPPADGWLIRYFRLYHNRPQHSWQVIGDTGSWAYYSTLLP